MNRCTFRMLLRSIRRSLGRYLAILAIVALGVGFFAGLKSSYPAMRGTADGYLRRQHFHDFRLLSSLGFSREDEQAFARLEGVAQAEGACFADAFALFEGKRDVYHWQTLPRRVDVPVLVAGRLPERAGECLADARAFGAEDLAKVIRLSEDNDEDTLKLLPGGSYTIVGLCRSPRYISDIRGDTSLGSGRVRAFLYLMEEDFDSEIFHEIALWCDLDGTLYSEAYEQQRDRMAETVKARLNQRGRLRQATLRQEAEEEIAEAEEELRQGWQDYEEGKAEAETELEDARQEIEKTKARLWESQQELDASREQLEAGMAAIPAARQEIAANRETLARSEQELNQGREQLDAARRELETQRQSLSQGQETLQAEKAAVCQPLLEQQAALQEQLSGTQTALEALGEEAPEQERAALEAAMTQLQEGLTQLQEGLAAIEAQFAGPEAELAAGQEALEQGAAQLDAQEAQLQEGFAALEAGKAELDAAEAELDAAEAEYPANRDRIFDAQWQIDNGWYQLEKGKQEYEQAKQDAETELADALRELEDAEAELAEARQELADKLQLDVYTLDRDSNPGYRTFDSDGRIIDGLADAFPIFFALVAALVCVTTMTRMVGEERTLIGTMKALGYGSGAVMSKYLLYAGSAALLGCAAGFFLGTWAIPHIVWVAYGIIYDYARLDFYFSPLMCALCLAAAVPGTLLVTWLACGRELREKPAELIRPRAPKAGRRILLEYLTPLWRRLPFLSKLSLRNAFRHPLRVLMMLLGIGGCTALLVTGFGARDSVARICDYQYEEIFLYDLAVSLDPEDFADDETAAALWRKEAQDWAMTWQEPVTLRCGEGREKSTRLIAAEKEALTGIIRLWNEEGDVPFPAPGEAVVTEKIAQTLDLQPGDELELSLDDGSVYALRLSGVCKNYLGHYVFADTASLGAPRHNTALLRAGAGVDAARLGARLRGEEGVTYVSSTAQERQSMEQSMASMNLLVLLLIFCSGALAFITLYNLTNINILERVREVATVKVLGFYPGETASYVLRENRLLAVLGAAIGLALGKLLHYVVIQAIVVDNMSCEIRITPLSYALAFAITIGFALLTNLAMHGKLEKINMAESLKAVE